MDTVSKDSVIARMDSLGPSVTLKLAPTHVIIMVSVFWVNVSAIRDSKRQIAQDKCV